MVKPVPKVGRRLQCHPLLGKGSIRKNLGNGTGDHHPSQVKAASLDQEVDMEQVSCWLRY